MSYVVKNPVKVVREEHNLTQRAFASLAGVTEQVVIRAESGMFGSLPPSIIEAVRTLNEWPSERITLEYESWVTKELSEVELLDPKLDEMILNPKEFKDWMKAVCALNGVPNTSVGFCKLFKMHPYVIDKWISGRLKSAPIQLIQRLAHMRGIL
jgi:DNA-binding XRE family transcriptional regulator